MKKIVYLVSASMLFFLALVNSVWAEDETYADKFLGSPLLILTILVVVDLIAIIFHKIRR